MVGMPATEKEEKGCNANMRFSWLPSCVCFSIVVNFSNMRREKSGSQTVDSGRTGGDIEKVETRDANCDQLTLIFFRVISLDYL